METEKDRDSLKCQLGGLMWNLWRGHEDDLVFLFSDLKEEKLYPQIVCYMGCVIVTRSQ